MRPPTRRELLGSTAGLAAAVSGCAGLTGDRSGTGETTDEQPTRAEPGSGNLDDPDRLVLRSGNHHQPVWLADPDSIDQSPRERRYRERHLIVDSSERADRLRVSEQVDTKAFRAFLGETDFDTATIFVDSTTVEDCFRLELCQISWRPTRISTEYARHTRSWTTQCEADDNVVESRLIRLPDTLDAGDVNSISSATGGGDCGQRPTGFERAGSSSGAGNASAGSEGSNSMGGGDMR